jgi:hypothetical protein
MPNVDSNGWSIHFETAGQRGRPPLVMILGLSHRLAHWGRLPGLLAESRTKSRTCSPLPAQPDWSGSLCTGGLAVGCWRRR